MSYSDPTIRELINQLEEAAETLGDDAKVRVAYQPNWPLRGTVAAVTVPEDDPYDEDEQAAGQDEDTKMLWLAVGSAPYGENPYGPKWAWRGQEDGW